jgi:hypothetical protein
MYRMYEPNVINDQNPDKLVYERDDRNQRLCMQCRFPWLEDMFHYEDGVIVGVDINFLWIELPRPCSAYLEFLLSLLSSEKNNVGNFVDPDRFERKVSQLYHSITQQ